MHFYVILGPSGIIWATLGLIWRPLGPTWYYFRATSVSHVPLLAPFGGSGVLLELLLGSRFFVVEQAMAVSGWRSPNPPAHSASVFSGKQQQLEYVSGAFAQSSNISSNTSDCGNVSIASNIHNTSSVLDHVPHMHGSQVAAGSLSLRASTTLEQPPSGLASSAEVEAPSVLVPFDCSDVEVMSEPDPDEWY